MTLTLIDPLASDEPGRYRDDVVEVVAESGNTHLTPPATPIVRTAHFRLARHGRKVLLTHRLRPKQLDNDLAGLLATELFAPGWLIGNETFERVFTGVVVSAMRDPQQAWTTFYDNTLARIHRSWRAGTPSTTHSSIDEIAPVYARALELVPPGRVLDLGSCFGFFALLLAERPLTSVMASDLNPGSMRLLDAVAHARGITLDTLTCDATGVPLPSNCVDSVTVIHLLEHLDPIAGRLVVREALRLATRRVVIAVPFEDELTAAYGHVRGFDLTTLTELGMATQRRFDVREHHGGWLVLKLR